MTANAKPLGSLGPSSRPGPQRDRSLPSDAPARPPGEDTDHGNLIVLKTARSADPAPDSPPSPHPADPNALADAHRCGVEHGWRLALSHAALRLLHLSTASDDPEAMLAAAHTLLNVRDDSDNLERDTALALEAIRTGTEPGPITLSNQFRADIDALSRRRDK